MTYMPHIRLTDECPCQSGKVFAQCCANTDFKPLYAVTRTPKPKTGFKKLRCYAAELGDCSKKISREHFLSEGILKILNENNDLTVVGLPWLKREEHRKLNPASLVANILCDRHNNVLSPLDAVAIRFFKALDQIEQEFLNEKTACKERVFLFNGHDIERWMLKTLCGFLYSNNASTLEGETIHWKPNITWLNMLFGTQKFPVGCGIYYEAKIGEKRDLYQGVDFSILLNQNDAAGGAIIGLKENKFALVMLTPSEDKQGTVLEHSVYRPYQLIFNKEKEPNYKVIVLAWDSKDYAENINITLSL